MSTIVRPRCLTKQDALPQPGPHSVVSVCFCRIACFLGIQIPYGDPNEAVGLRVEEFT